MGDVLPVRGRRRQRRCPDVPWPALWDVKQSPAGVWDWEVHRLEDWPGSIDSGTDRCESAPSSAPRGRSDTEEKEKRHTNVKYADPPLRKTTVGSTENKRDEFSS